MDDRLLQVFVAVANVGFGSFTMGALCRATWHEDALWAALLKAPHAHVGDAAPPASTGLGDAMAAAPPGRHEGSLWLVAAAALGHHERVAWLLPFLPPTAALDDALYFAAEQGQDRSIKLLATAGADIEARRACRARTSKTWRWQRRPESPLLAAITRRHSAAALELVALGAALQGREAGVAPAFVIPGGHTGGGLPWTDWSAAHAAARGDDVGVLAAILDRGVAVDALCTYLDWIASNIDPDADVLLVETALEGAIRMSSLAAVQLLLERGACPRGGFAVQSAPQALSLAVHHTLRGYGVGSGKGSVPIIQALVSAMEAEEGARSGVAGATLLAGRFELPSLFASVAKATPDYDEIILPKMGIVDILLGAAVRLNRSLAGAKPGAVVEASLCSARLSAALAGSAAVLDELLPVDFDASLDESKRLVTAAAASGDVPTLHVLFRRGAYPSYYQGALGEWRLEDAFCAAIENRHADALRALVDATLSLARGDWASASAADVHAARAQLPDVLSLLMCTGDKGFVGLTLDVAVALFFSSDSDVPRKELGGAALCAAAWTGRIPTLTALLDAGVDAHAASAIARSPREEDVDVAVDWRPEDSAHPFDSYKFSLRDATIPVPSHVDSSSRLLLYYAVAGGSLEAVQLLVSRGCEILVDGSWSSSKKKDPLRAALRQPNIEVFRLLFVAALRGGRAGSLSTLGCVDLLRDALGLHNKSGARLISDVCTDLLRSGLSAAAFGSGLFPCAGVLGSVELLTAIEDATAEGSPLAPQWDLDVALNDAARAGCVDAVRFLLDHGANPFGVRNSLAEYGRPSYGFNDEYGRQSDRCAVPLNSAATWHRAEVLRKLLRVAIGRNGSDGVADRRRVEGLLFLFVRLSPLQSDDARLSPSEYEALLSSQTHLDREDGEGSFSREAQETYDVLFEVLRAAFASRDAHLTRDLTICALQAAAAGEYLDAIRRLLDPEVMNSSPAAIRPPLAIALEVVSRVYVRRAVVTTILDAYRGDPSKGAVANEFLLLWALEGRVKGVEALLSRGADVSRPLAATLVHCDPPEGKETHLLCGSTALLLAVRGLASVPFSSIREQPHCLSSYVAIVRELLARGADPHATDELGVDAIHEAEIAQGHVAKKAEDEASAFSCGPLADQPYEDDEGAKENEGSFYAKPAEIASRTILEMLHGSAAPQPQPQLRTEEHSRICTLSL